MFQFHSPSPSVFEPTLKRLILLVGEGRVEVLDGDVRRRDQHGLGVGERIKAVLAVVVAHSRRAGAAERHGLNKQVNVHHIHSATTEGQLADESVICPQSSETELSRSTNPSMSRTVPSGLSPSLPRASRGMTSATTESGLSIFTT